MQCFASVAVEANVAWMSKFYDQIRREFYLSDGDGELILSDAEDIFAIVREDDEKFSYATGAKQRIEQIAARWNSEKILIN